MAKIKVSIEGPSRDARLFWNAKSKPLRKSGREYAASFSAAAGDHVYVVTMAGSPGEAWSVTVSGGSEDFEHKGHMSPGGIDTTGDTPYEV